ncbi:hypothetical protein C0995_003752 [Termitomyces sp. Mi166|nr:hypothetical protein C0995_003752 [Termitomyces sp. Mi166\
MGWYAPRNPDYLDFIRHTTVCQIIKADRIHSTAPFKIEGNEFKKIILLGNLSIRQNSAKYTDFDLDDGTGIIVVRLWDRNNDIDFNKTWDQFVASPYTRVIGEVDNWNNSNRVTATKIELACSPYEPYHHILQAIHDTIVYERGHPGYQQVILSSEYKESAPDDISGLFDSTLPSQVTPTQTSNFGALSSIWKGKDKAKYDDSPLPPRHPGSSRENFRDSRHIEDGSGNTGVRSSSTSSPPSSPLVPTCLENLDTHKLYSRLPSLDRDILNYISSTKANAGSQDSWKGVYLPMVVAAVSSLRTDLLTREEFTESLERLIKEGFVFPSIDDDHYDITLSPAYSIGFELLKNASDYKSTAQDPLGLPFPGLTWNEEGLPNWVGHLITKYVPRPRFIAEKKATQDPEYLKRPMLVYDCAIGGDTIAGVQRQIHRFLPSVGQRPDWALWSPASSLFRSMIRLFELQEELYGAGARNFLFIDVPPIDRSPAGKTQQFRERLPKSHVSVVYQDYNAELEEAAKEFAKQHPDITVLLHSSAATFNRLLDSPEEYGFSQSDCRKAGGAIWYDWLHPTSKKSLGQFLKPGQFDSHQIDSKIGSGFVQINNLQLDDQTINALISDLPVSLQVGSISSLIVRIPWPNPLSSTLGFSIDSLHLTFVVRPPSSLSANTPSNLADSVASVAESFVHDELSPQEEATLWESFHTDATPRTRDDPSVPGGILADPFLSNPDEPTYSDSDPAGVSIFATLIEHLLARFEFDATNTKVTLVHPENMCITASISDIRYHTDNSSGVSAFPSDTVHFRGQQHTISISGLTLSTRNLRSGAHYSELYTPTGHSLSSIIPRRCPRDSPQPISPSSSSSSMDEEAQFAMSQSLAFLPPKQPSSSSSAASSMYQSAISTAPTYTEREDDIVAEKSWSRTPSLVAQPVDSPKTPLPPHSYSFDHNVEEIMVSFGSSPLLFHINTSSPVSPEEPSVPRQERSSREEVLQATITLGVISCALQAWQIRGLLDLTRDLPSHFREDSSEAYLHKSSFDFNLLTNLRGLVLLLPLSPSHMKTTNVPLLTDFFKRPLVPPALPHSYVRLYIETVAASLSSISDSVDSLSKDAKPRSPITEGVACTFTIEDFSLFYIYGSPNIVSSHDLIASPLLITDPDLVSQYELYHRHPSKDSVDLNLPTFGLVDWTAGDQSSNGLKLSLWRTKSTQRRNTTHQRDDAAASSPSALILNARYRITSSGDDLQDTSYEIQIRFVPLHIFLDLGTVLRGDEFSTFLVNSFGGKASVDRPSIPMPESDDFDDNGGDGAKTPPASSNFRDERERERIRLENLVLKDLDLDFDYGVKKRDASRPTKQRSRKSNKGHNLNMNTSVVFSLIRVQIRCPSPPKCSPRSGALLVDFHDVRLCTSPEPSKKSARFVNDSAQVSESSAGTREAFLVGAGFERMIVAYCPASESKAKTLLSIGSLATSADDVLEIVSSPLLPRVAVTKSFSSSNERSQVVAISIDIPSVAVDITKSLVDGLQYWADDVAQLMDRLSSELTKKAESRDTSLIGSHYFAKSRNESESAWGKGSELSQSKTVVKLNVLEVFIRILVPRSETMDTRPFIVYSSDIDLLVEPNPEGQDEMVLTLGVMDVTIRDMLTSTSSRTYLSLTSPRSLTSTPNPMVKPCFTSLILPGTVAKESRLKLNLSGFMFTLFPDLTWIKDLESFVQSPPETFESVIPSERTRISLRILDGAIRVFAPNHPGAVVIHIDDLEFATDVIGESPDSSFCLSIPSLALLAVDDISNEVTVDDLFLRRGATLWKAAGFALIAEIEDLSMVVIHTTAHPATSAKRSRIQMHIAADSLTAVSAFANDVGSVFQPISEESRLKAHRGPTLVSKGHTENSGLMGVLEIFLRSSSWLTPDLLGLASVDDLAFKKVPEVGPAPDLIYDDLPTNMDYLDESFGAAAGLRELRDDDLDEFDVEELQAGYPDNTPSGVGVVSRVGGETIRMHRPEGIKVIDNHFEIITPQTTDDDNGETVIRLRVKNSNITLLLYNGYDWLKTRKTIEEEVKEMRRRLAKIRQLVASGQVQDPSTEDTGALLFNSIYIGLDHDVEGLEPGAIIAAIDEELEEDVETGSQSSWQSLKPPVSGKSRTRSVRVHGRCLTRSRGPSMEFRFLGFEASVDHYVPDATLLSRTFVTVRDAEILDHIKTSTWKKFLTELRSDSRGNVRETDSNMVQFEILTVRPVPGHSATEARLRAKILPLRLYVDQDAVDFLKSFFSFKDPHATPAPESGSEEIYFQSAEIFPIDLKLDYKPRRVNYLALREGRTIELMNFFHFDGAEMTLRHITLAGVTGWATLGQLLNDLWTPDVKATQLVDVISGVAPIRSAVNVGSGVADLVLLPITQYKKDGRIVRGVQKGATAFVKSTALEAIKLGARLATGTQVILEQAEGVLGGQFNYPITTETVSIGTGDDFTQLENEDNDDPDDMISKYAQQPADLKEGVQSAYKSLQRNFQSAAQTILAVPMEVYERSGSEGPVRSVIRAVPVAVLKPMIGASEAVSKTLLGLHNSLDPDTRHEYEAKYKHR